MSLVSFGNFGLSHWLTEKQQAISLWFWLILQQKYNLTHKQFLIDKMIPSGSHRLFRENEFSLCRKHDRCLQLCLKARKRLHVATMLKEQIFQIGGILQSTCKHLRQVILPLCRHLSFQMRKYPYRKGKQNSANFAVSPVCGGNFSYNLLTL